MAPLLFEAMSRSIRDAGGEEEQLGELDRAGQSDAEQDGEPPARTAEEQDEEHADRREHRDVGGELHVGVIEPASAGEFVQCAQHPPDHAVGAIAEGQ